LFVIIRVCSFASNLSWLRAQPALVTVDSAYMIKGLFEVPLNLTCSFPEAGEKNGLGVLIWDDVNRRMFRVA
jgi:hypothetical protein